MSIECKEVYYRQRIWHDVSPGSNSGIPILIGICITTNSREEFTAIGEILKPVVGERYKLWGQWEDSKKNKGKKDFHFHSFEIVAESTIDGLTDYLDRYVDDIGKVRSRQIVEHFGPENVLKILRENPFRVKEIKGIGTATAEAIKEHFDNNESGIDPAAYASVADILSGTGANRRTISDILRDFGASAIQVIRENPYLLLDYSGIGWKTVDTIVRKKLKYDPDGIHRHRAAVLEIIKRHSSEFGDTYVTSVDLECKASQDLNVNISKDSISSLIKDCTIEETLLQGPTKRPIRCYSLRSLWEAEREIAFRLKMLAESCAVDVPDVDTTGLEGEQIPACKFVQVNPVSCLIGPPGVGKTTTITKIIETLWKHGRRVVFVAPTGKAAKRASEVLQQWLPGNLIPVSTIHRSLEPMPYGSPLGVPEENAKFGRSRDKFMFTRTEDNPIDMEIGIIDEMSMVDTELFLEWLRAVPLGCRLIFVGDVNQLPSVGAGAILRDMIAGGIPTYELTKPRRNSGRIVFACHSIKDGRSPTFSKELDLSIGENLFHIPMDDMNDIAREIVELHDSTNRDPMWDLQVISPQNGKIPIACDNLNMLLSRKLNPKGKSSDLLSKYDNFRIGDKVVRTKNAFVELMTEADVGSEPDDDYGFDDWGDVAWNGRDWTISKTPIVNGDIGQVLDICKIHGKPYVIVKFRSPDRICRLKTSEAHLELAYAITCHKAQGSGFPAVILPVHNSFHWNEYTKSGLWHRELLYTMISRGIDVVITVGQESAIKAAISRKTIDKRRTMLSHHIKTAA